MAHANSQHAAVVPLPAKVCMNFFMHSTVAKSPARVNKVKASKTPGDTQRDEKTTEYPSGLPALLGRRQQLVLADTNHDASSPPGATFTREPSSAFTREPSSDRSSDQSNSCEGGMVTRSKTLPALLGGISSSCEGRMVTRSKTLPAFTVKNTFVHVDLNDDSDSDFTPALKRCASAPSKFKASRLLQRGLISPSIMRRARRSPESIIEPASTEDSSAGKNQHSIGSRLHGTGDCKPCAWFWRVGGCENGSQCRHCHLCPEGEIKRRRKTRFLMARQRRQALFAGTLASGASDGESGKEDVGY